MRKVQAVIGFILLVSMLLAACGGQTTPTPFGPDEPPGNNYENILGSVYISEANLMVMESYPIQVALNISGELPTPCHTVRAIVTPPDGDMEFHIQIYSEAKADEVCIQVLQPFSENVSLPLQGLADGTYSVWLNDEKVGEFNYPGG